MAKLNIPGVDTQGVPQGIGITTGANAVLGAKGVGDAMMGMGQSMISQGAQQVDSAANALGEAAYQAAQGKAMTDVTTLVNDRFNKPLDDNGNPTFGSLTTDVNKIYDDAINKYGAGIIDPETKQKFLSSMNELKMRHTLQAQQQARSQQESFAKANLITYTDSAQTAALKDSVDNLPYYQSQINSAIDAQVKSGVISPDEAAQMRIKQRELLSSGKMSEMILRDPVVAKAYLENPQLSASIGVNEVERETYLKKADAAIADQQHKQMMVEKQKQTLISQQQSIVETTASIAIKDGQMSRALLDDLVSSDKISLKQYNSLLGQYISQQGKGASEQQQLSEIASAVQNKEVIGNQYSGKLIDKYVQQQYSVMKRPDGQPLTLMDKAHVVAPVNAQVPSIVSEIKGTIFNSKNTKQVLDAVQAYDYLNTHNPLAVSGLDADSKDMIAYMATNLKFASSDPLKVIDQARKMMQITPQDKQFRSENFKTLVPTKDLESEMQSLLKTNPLFSSNAEISPDIYSTTYELYKQAYIRTGDLDAAWKSVQYSVAGSIGISEVAGKKMAMFLPPEKFMVDPVTKQPLSTDKINSLLDRDIASVMQDNPHAPKIVTTGLMGTTEENIINSHSDVFLETLKNATPQNPQYLVGYTDPNTGERSYLIDKNGAPVVFHYSQEDAMKDQQDRLNKADAIAKEALSMPTDAEKFQSLTDFLGLTKSKDHTVQKLNTSKADGYLPPQSSSEKLADIIRSTKPVSPMSIAGALLGKNEHENSDVLSAFFTKNFGQKVNPQNTPWCAVFVNSVLQAGGVKGTGSAAARSFLSWGNETADPSKGDIAVFSRTDNPELGHVGFVNRVYQGADGQEYVEVLGGNQADSVSLKAYPMSAVLGFRTAGKGDGHVNNNIAGVMSQAKQVYPDSPVMQKIAVAQAALESNLLGKPSRLAREHNNLFGIKGSGSAGTSSMNTREFLGGSMQSQNANFASNESVSDSFAQHRDLMSKDRYASVRNASSFEEAAQALQRAGYATDPNYAKKLISIKKRLGL